MSFFDSYIDYFEQTVAGKFFIDFLLQPIDKIMYDLLIYVGWVPILVVLIRGLLEVWKDHRQVIWMGKQENVLLAINVPRESEQSPKAVENIFAVLTGALSVPNFKDKWIAGQERRIFSLEIAAVDGYVQYYIRTNVRFRNMLESAIYAQYPDAEIYEIEDYTKTVPDEMPDDDWDMIGDEFKLAKDEYMPIRTWPSFEHSLSQELKDPLGSLLEMLSQLKTGEQVWLQIILIPTLDKWKEAGDAFIKKTFGLKDAPKKSMTEEITGHFWSIFKGAAQEIVGIPQAGEQKSASATEEMFKMFKVTEQERAMVKAVNEKISKPGFKCKIRYIYIARKEVFREKMIKDAIRGYFRQFAHLDLNALFSVPKISPRKDYFWQAWYFHAKQTTLLQAFKSRAHTRGITSYILNVEELATLYHFPTVLIKAPMVQRTVSKRAEPPPQLRFAGEIEEHRTTPATDFGQKKTGLTFEIDGLEESEISAGEAGTTAKPFLEPLEKMPVSDLPMVTAPTKPLNAQTVRNIPGALESVLSPSQSEKPLSKAASEVQEIPEAVRVLIDPNVALDIPANGEIVEKNPPNNLPI